METKSKSIGANIQIVAQMGSIMFFTTSFYFVLLRRKITIFFEYLLFYEETVIEEEVDKCAEEYNKPIELAQYNIPEYIVAVKSASSCFRLKNSLSTDDQLDTEEIQTDRLAHKNSIIDSNLFQAKISGTRSVFRRSIDIGLAKKIMPTMNDNTMLKTTTIDCVVCFNKKVDCFYLPCGHSGICLDCSQAILKTSGCCHFCRKVES